MVNFIKIYFGMECLFTAVFQLVIFSEKAKILESSLIFFLMPPRDQPHSLFLIPGIFLDHLLLIHFTDDDTETLTYDAGRTQLRQM